MTLLSLTGRLTAVSLIVVLVAAGVSMVHAQQRPPGPSNALQGFTDNRDKPFEIDAATLEVIDGDKMASFSGDVHVSQGGVDLRSKTLVVIYAGDAPVQPLPSAKGAALMQLMPAQVKRIEAKGGAFVRVPQKDQTASGDLGVVDMQANTVTIQGNVIITQGPNVLKGDTLVVDLNTGDSHFRGGRAEQLFKPRSLISNDRESRPFTPQRSTLLP